MKTLIQVFLFLLGPFGALGQELYVQTEPASNMASHSIGFRLNQDLKPMGEIRINPEIMLGLNKDWMVHINLFASNDYQRPLNWEGFNLYGKYRIFANDEPQTHLRLSAFGRISYIQSQNPYHEINLQGDNSGYQGGLILTQLLHKVAISSSIDFSQEISQANQFKGNIHNPDQWDYSLSFGYLFLPQHYTSYKQTNLNLYLEFLGKNSLNQLGSYLDLAPSIQFIFQSRARLDLGYSTQLWGNLSRNYNHNVFIRLEYTIFNAY